MKILIRSASALLILVCCAAAASPVKPADLLRAQICLNGDWETVLNAPDDQIPAAGWVSRRVPAAPLATDPPTISAWYRRSFTLPREWARADRRLLLQVEKAGHYAAVYCNGRRLAEHYGQYTPFETDLTGALEPGKSNTIAIYVHNASGKYARPGALVTEPFAGNAYRGATNQEFQRNWVGIVGDVVLAWRPATHIEDVFVIPSVRKKRLEARVATQGAAGLTLRAAVLDREKIVLQLPKKPVTSDGVLSLAADWSDAVLWAPPPYGEPKLYVLRAELLKNGKVIDRSFTRFGFREVWVSGRDVLLNGKKLWLSGTYFSKLSPLRYLNDRHPQSLMIGLMQASGLNVLHGHWDDLGTPWMNLCDETGMLVMAGFYCDGRPQIQSKAGDGWEDWMAGTCRDWVRATRYHPSIVMWRPTDVLPQEVLPRRAEFVARLAEEVRREDGTRPLADDSDIAAWAQSPFKDPRTPGDYDDGSRMADRLAASAKPLLTKEIYSGFADVENLSRFFRTFYEKSFQGGGTGVIVQQMPLFTRSRPFHVEWLSESGFGNRDNMIGESPNWCDPGQPAWNAGPYSHLFADLHRKFMNREPAPSSRETAGELLVSGLAPGALVVLVPKDPSLVEAIGVRAAADGKAWIVAPQPGEYRVAGLEITVRPAPFPSKPGYHQVQRLSAAPKTSR